VAEILVVSGLSGAGKSTCLRALEDLGYLCVDNLPVPLLPALVAIHPPQQRIAIGIDARSPAHLHAFAGVHAQLLADGHRLEILFVEAPVPTLVRRYSETRRRHPVGELPDAITREAEQLREIRALANAVIDTETLGSRALRQLVRDRYGTHGGLLHLVLLSFGFKNGLPSEADLVFDARFLVNPFDVPELRSRGGFDDAVREFVLGQPDARELLDRVENWLRFQAPRTIREGRSTLTVALGCTGGQHRSVSLVEALRERIAAPAVADPPPVITVRHRDLERALADTAELQRQTP
jgi:UPF0042 nucleotide-binding protein